MSYNQFKEGYYYKYIRNDFETPDNWIPEMKAFLDGRPRKCLKVDNSYGTDRFRAAFKGIRGGLWFYNTSYNEKRMSYYMAEMLPDEIENPFIPAIRKNIDNFLTLRV